MKRYLLILMFIHLLTSCTFQHVVYLKADGTAEISTLLPPDSAQFITRLHQSNFVSDISIEIPGYEVKYKVHAIDSIGKYVPFYNPGFLKFETAEETISVRTGDVAAYDSRHAHCTSFSLYIKTEKAMEGFHSNGKSINRKNKTDKDFWLFIKSRKLARNRKNINVTLKPKSN